MRYNAALCILVAFGFTSATQAELLAVSTMQVSEQSSYQVKRIYGGQLKHRRQSDMGFEISGIIKQVHVDEGDVVTRGQVLVTLDQAAQDAELNGTIARVATAEANLRVQQEVLKLSDLTYGRNQALARNGHISIQVLDELSQQQRINAANLMVAQSQLTSAIADTKKAQVKFTKSVITAPYRGIVQSRFIDEGSIIAPGETAISLVETGRIEAHLGIPANMVPMLKTQGKFDFLINGNLLPGRFKTTLPRVDSVTGTVTSIFTLDADYLYAGSLVEMTMSVTMFEKGFWIPLSALTESQRGLWSVLAVVDAMELSTVETRLVEIIHQGSDAVYVRGTLADGDLIVYSGTSRVVPGQAVRVARRTDNSLVLGS